MTTTEQELAAARAETRYLCPGWEETTVAESNRAVRLWTRTAAGPKSQSPRHVAARFQPED